MKNFAKLVLVVFGLISIVSAAFAHSKVNTTKPEDEAVLQQAPSFVDMTFSSKIRLTKVTLQIENRDPIDIDLDSYKGFENSFSFPNASESSGKHTIEWRGLSIDGHVMQGEFSFTVE